MKNAKYLFLIAAAFVVTGFAFGTTATADETAQKELAAIYAKLDAAVKAKDTKTLFSYFGEEFEMTMGGKTLKRAEAVAHIQKNIESAKEFTVFTTAIDKIEQVEGNEIVDITQEFKLTATFADGKDHTVEGTSKSREWWIKGDDGKWTLINSEELSNDVEIDGQKVP